MKTYRSNEHRQFCEQKNCNSGNILPEIDFWFLLLAAADAALGSTYIWKKYTYIYWALTQIITKTINNIVMYHSTNKVGFFCIKVAFPRRSHLIKIWLNYTGDRSELNESQIHSTIVHITIFESKSSPGHVLGWRAQRPFPRLCALGMHEAAPRRRHQTCQAHACLLRTSHPTAGMRERTTTLRCSCTDTKGLPAHFSRCRYVWRDESSPGILVTETALQLWAHGQWSHTETHERKHQALPLRLYSDLSQLP